MFVLYCPLTQFLVIMKKKITFLCYFVLFFVVLSAQTYKSNVVRTSANAVYFADWAGGGKPLGLQLGLEYQRNIHAHYYLIGSIFNAYSTAKVPSNTYPSVYARRYYNVDLGLGYIHYLSNKCMLNGQISVSYRNRVIRTIDEMSSEPNLSYYVDKKLGLVPSIHLRYLPLKWLELSVGAYYRFYPLELPTLEAHYPHSENKFLLGTSIGFLFGKNRERK